jgi:hypothetical protein
MTTVYEIPLTPGTPQRCTVSLGGVPYALVVAWNHVSALWVVDLFDSAGNPVLSGVPLVAGANLLAPVAYLGIGGALYAQNDNDPNAAPTYGDLGDTSHVYFVVSP